MWISIVMKVKPQHNEAGLTYKHLYNVWTCIFLNILQPSMDIAKGLFLGDVISNEDCVGTAIVTLGDGTEPFLARCVPYL